MIHAMIYQGQNQDLDHMDNWNVEIDVESVYVERGFDSLQGAYDFIEKWAEDRTQRVSVSFAYQVGKSQVGAVGGR